MEWDNITGGTGSGIGVNGQNGHCALRKETPQICMIRRYFETKVITHTYLGGMSAPGNI